MRTTYKIHTLSARAIIGFEEPDGDLFSFRLGRRMTERCILSGAATAQEDCSLIYQIRCVLNGGSFPDAKGPSLVTDLTDVIFEVDFKDFLTSAGCSMVLYADRH